MLEIGVGESLKVKDTNKKMSKVEGNYYGIHFILKIEKQCEQGGFQVNYRGQ